jgi:7-cyano-7-deazaguanine synthase
MGRLQQGNKPPFARGGRQPLPRAAYVLMGGGVDSTALVPLLLKEGFVVRGIHFDYGQPAARLERRAAGFVSEHYGIKLEHARLYPHISNDDRAYRLRNASLILAGVQSVRSPCVLAIGIHDGTGFYDCSFPFFEKVRGLLAEYSGGSIRLIAPWLKMSKGEIILWARRQRVPLTKTYSCQAGTDPPCGRCLSCQDRDALL